jgi:hypothetical protein
MNFAAAKKKIQYKKKYPARKKSAWFRVWVQGLVVTGLGLGW